MGSFFTHPTKKDKNYKYEQFDIFDNNNVIKAESIIKKIIQLNNDTNIDKFTKTNIINNLVYEYDMIVVKLNTEYNINQNKTDINLENHMKIIRHLLNLKISHINPIIIRNY